MSLISGNARTTSASLNTAAIVVGRATSCSLARVEQLFYHHVMASTQPQRPYNVRYYATHRQAELERVKRRQDATLRFLRGLRRVPCDDCGEMFPPHMMDFDHRDPG